MKVIDKLKHGRTVSVEIIPPRLGQSRDTIERVLDPLVDLGVSFVNITYHAEKVVDFVSVGGYTSPVVQSERPGTAGVAGFIVQRYKGVEPVPHVICARFNRRETEAFLAELWYLRVENVLAIRGDDPKDGYPAFLPDGNKHANELIEQIVDLRKGKYVAVQKGSPIDFCIGAACYPEKHQESPTWESEFHFTKLKVERGADYLTTQIFFDNSKYFWFVERARAEGINVPILPGIQPIAKCGDLTKLPEISSCTIPDDLRREICAHKDDEKKVREVGIEWCVAQCKELLSHGAPGLHLYLGRNAPVKEVLERLYSESR